MHKQNLSKRSIQTWKNHFIASLAGLPDNFPITYWCSLIKQTNTTLNLLHPYHPNPALSAEAAINRCFNFDAIPMAPLGIKVSVHLKPNKRKSWGYYALTVWYVGLTKQHYQCYEVIMESTGAKRIIDTVKFHHHKVVLPKITQADRILKATKELNEAISKVPNNVPPTYVDAVQQL
eukprot:7444798-Ditylum_brightwellii.AAC.2